jgi:hypothetical protein
MVLRHIERFWMARDYDIFIDEDERKIVLKNDTGQTIRSFDY